MHKTTTLEHPLSRIMTTGELVTASVDDPLESVLARFREGRLSHVPVLNGDGRLVGVVSPADILKLPTRAHGVSPLGALTVGDVMTKNIETVRPTATVGQAAALFSSGDFHSLLVTSSDGELLGIVTTSDVIRALLA